MATVTAEVPGDAFSVLRRSPKEFAEDMRLAATIQWYHQRLISQSKAAAIAGLNRRDFLMALYHCHPARRPARGCWPPIRPEAAIQRRAPNACDN